MSYTPTEWATGDVVTAEKLNKIEGGIANAGGGLVVANLDRTTYALDKTWKQIHNADFSVIKTTIEDESSRASGYFIIIGTAGSSNVYSIDAVEFSVEDGGSTVYTFTTTSEDGYPVIQQPQQPQ